MDNNFLYYGDNIDILRNKIKSETVDLCYIDPPFNSKRNYFQIYNNIGSEDKAQSQAFMDTWEWGDESIKGLEYLTDIYNVNNGKVSEKVFNLIQGLHTILGKSDLFSYLLHMTQRIIEIHRVLKENGSFYLHCDPVASHYLKIILDAVFCDKQGDFLNEIIWCYASGGVSQKHFARKHDVILFYVKGLKYTFNVDDVREPYSSPEKVEFKTVNGKDYKRKHDLGRVPLDWWQIPILTNTAKERLGYPTQKPEALLEKIIKASSNEGDVVLDAYCGCGTTVAVAQRLNRQWIGVDITYQSISLILKRLQDSYPNEWCDIEKNLLLDGIPKDIESAKALVNRLDDKTRKEFEKWAILTFSNNQAIINQKKGADKGVDGTAYFAIDREKNGKIIFQVKSGKAKRSDIATLNSDRLREEAQFAYFITLSEATKPMYEEAKLAGKYTHQEWQKQEDHLKIVTIQEILDGKRIDLFLLHTLTKKASSLEADKKQKSLL